MARRHKLNPERRETVLLRLQELLMANSGENAYEEAFKLVVAKIFDEINVKNKKKKIFKTYKTPRETRENINKLLHMALENWPGSLDEGKTNLNDTHLDICVSEISDIVLLDKNIEIIDDLFEHLVSSDSKGNKGQYFTPRSVIDFAVQLIDPKIHENIIDPSCGSGGFLVHSLNYIKEKNKNLYENNVWGFDFDPRAVRIARTLLRISGIKNPNVYNVNSLINDNSLDFLIKTNENLCLPATIESIMSVEFNSKSKFDVLFANPPFAGEIKEKHILNSYDISKEKSSIERDALFLERCTNLLNPGGRFAIILPHNKLAGAAWEKLRIWFMRRVKISLVVGLPRATFMPHTPQKTALVIGEKRKNNVSYPPKNEEIMFSICDKIGKDSSGRLIKKIDSDEFSSLWERSDHDLHEILYQYQTYLEKKEKI